MKKKALFVVMFLALATVLPACGGKRDLKTESVTGTVTLDGAPLAQCSVFFIPQGKGNQTVAITNDIGEYDLKPLRSAADDDGIIPGTYKVFFSHEVVVSHEETNDVGEVLKEAVTEVDLPEKYLTSDTSGFIVDVAPGENTFDFNLTSE